MINARIRRPDRRTADAKRVSINTFRRYRSKRATFITKRGLRAERRRVFVAGGHAATPEEDRGAGHPRSGLPLTLPPPRRARLARGLAYLPPLCLGVPPPP